MSPMTERGQGRKVVIAGAGISGLAAATWLDQKGYDVCLYEAAERAGGRAHSIRRPNSDDVVDVGTQYFHSNYRLIRGLIRQCGLQGDLSRISGSTLFFDERVSGGSFKVSHRVPYFASGSVFQNARLLVKSLGRLAANLIDPFAVLPVSAIDYQAARVLMPDPFEWEYVARSSIVVGSLEEPFDAPVSYLHLIRLMRIIGVTDYLSFKGGITSFYDKLAASLKVETNTPVAALKLAGGEIKGLVLDDGRMAEADHVIVATPPEAALKIMPESWLEERKFLHSVKRPSAVIVTLFLNRRLEEDVWSYMFRADRNRLVSFCVDTARKNPAMTPSGLSGLQAWICSPAASEVMDCDDDALIKTVIAELVAYFPTLEADIETCHVHRLIHTVPQAHTGHNGDALEFLGAMDKRAGIDFCGDYFSGGYAECGAWSAQRAVKRILST